MDVPILDLAKLNVVIELVFKANETTPVLKQRTPAPDPKGIHLEGDTLVLGNRTEWIHLTFKIVDEGSGRTIKFPKKKEGSINYSDDGNTTPKPWRYGASHQFADIEPNGNKTTFCYTNDPVNAESYYSITYFIDDVPYTPDPRIKNGFSLSADGGGEAGAVLKAKCKW